MAKGELLNFFAGRTPIRCGGMHVSERDSVIAQVMATKDLLEVLTALLSTCRAHPHQLADIIQDADHRRAMARRVREVRDALPRVAVGDRERQLLCAWLGSADNYVVEARIIALGIDQKFDPSTKRGTAAAGRVLVSSHGTRFYRNGARKIASLWHDHRELSVLYAQPIGWPTRLARTELYVQDLGRSVTVLGQQVGGIRACQKYWRSVNDEVCAARSSPSASPQAGS
jgi:hypothetical protein